MTVAEKHSAGASIAGFCFQIDRAIEWLSKADSGGTVGIETLDDVVYNDPAGNTHIEQDKLSFHRNPITDRSENLWKSLHIWISLIENGECELDSAQFYLVTTMPVKTGLSRSLCDLPSNRRTSEIIRKMREVCASPNDDWKVYASHVSRQTDGFLGNFLSRVWVICDAPFGEDDSHLGNILQLPLSIVEPVVSGIRGWILTKFIQNITNALGGAHKKPAWLQVEEFREVKSRLISRYFDTRLTVRAAREIIIPAENVESAKAETFVRQLEIINFDTDHPDGFIDAITDFLRSNEERTRLAAQGTVTSIAFEQYEGNLIDHWRILKRKNERVNFHDDQLAGQNLLDDSLLHTPQLDGHHLAEGYLPRGTYHDLANSKTVGWHPKYLDLLKI